jgi:alpha-beta hydrolase superfamily lysophospholipase
MESSPGNSIYIHDWTVEQPKAIVHIIHGMSEHGARYEHFANALNKANYSAYASDLRGHGKTAGGIENIGFFAESDGWNTVIQDIVKITNEIKAKHPDLPIFILGHSMGSLLARNIAYIEPNLVNGHIFSGTSGHPGWKGVLGKPMAKAATQILGKRKKSKSLMKATFAGFNKKIENKRTDQDWLTRDDKIVDAYINDPYCSQIFTNQFFYDLATGVLDVSKQSNINKVNKSTPVLFISGEMDPVGKYGKGVLSIFRKFEKAAIQELEIKLFQGGRHEILNEINKEEVYEFVITWIEGQIE